MHWLTVLTAIAGLLAPAICQADAASDRPKVDFYGEALCPYCARFLIKTVAPLFDKGLLKLFDFRYIPYGNARQIDGKVVCQHGPLECEANTVLGCVLAHHPDPSDWLPYVRCVESHNASSIVASLTSCAEGTVVDLKRAFDCAKGTEGRELQQCAAEETASLKPPHKYVPWVVLEGLPLEDEFEALWKLVCAAYPKDARPDECYELSGGSFEVGGGDLGGRGDGGGKGGEGGKVAVEDFVVEGRAAGGGRVCMVGEMLQAQSGSRPVATV